LALPPFQDILILGRKCPHGPEGVVRCFNLLGPDEFEVVSVEDDKVEAVMINKRILTRLPLETVVGILKQRVFPFMAKGELVRVDFNVTLSYDDIEGTLDQAPEESSG
jgi:hypothetical protein